MSAALPLDPSSTAEADRLALSEILLAPDPTEGLWIALENGLLARAFPEIPALQMEQDPVHRHKDVLTHSIVVTAKTEPRLRLRLAALFHDVGKPATRRIKSGKVTFYHHEAVGERMTVQRLKLAGFEPAMVADVGRLVGLSGRFHGYQHGWEDSAVRRYARDAGHLLGDLNELVRCDCTTRHANKVAALHQRVDELEVRIRDLAVAEERAKERPDLNGQDVMTLMNVPAGPMVGRALKMLLEHRREHGVLERDEAEALLRSWWAENEPL
jgi:poly(A) polymerase